MIRSFVLLLLFRTAQQSLLCPNGGIPESLTSASVWQKNASNSLAVFRIGDNNLSDEGYIRSNHDKNLFIVLLSKASSKNCPVGSCAFKLSANQHTENGNILHQENVFGAPFGFTEITNVDPLCCVRIEGDCGADVPIYRYINITGLTARYAYSLDPNATIPGFSKEPTPLCYGWSDGGSHKVATSLRDSGCKKVPEPVNGEVQYRPESLDTFPLGSSASLLCSSGYTTLGPTELVCSHTGWYPNNVFEPCLAESTVERLEARCSPLSAPSNGQIVYNKEVSSEYTEGTLAHLQCNDGYGASSTTPQTKCQRNGHWTIENLGTCDRMCKHLSSVPNGEISYMTKSSDQLITGTVARLQCFPGYSVVGQESVTCEASDWLPFPGIGSCASVNSQCPFGLPMVLGGEIKYNQGGIFGPYPSGTVASLMCSSGLSVNGHSNATCQGTAWNPPSLGVCIPATTASRVVSTERVSGTTESSEGSAGNEVSKARGVGIFEAINPVTVPSEIEVTTISNEQCINGIPNPAVGRVIYSQGKAFGPYPAGTIATLKCTTGYNKNGETSSCHNGQWYPPSFSPCTTDIPPSGAEIDASFVAECLTGVPRPLHGRVTYSNSQNFGPFPSGTIASIACNAGYSPTGSTAFTCQEGIWSPGTFAQCMPGGVRLMAAGGIDSSTGIGSCAGGLPVPLNGGITYSDLSMLGPYPSGTAATLTCNLGYTPSGPVSSICQNGLWSPALLGECVLGATGGLGLGSIGGNSCTGGLAMPLNGFISYSSGILPPYPSGTLATVICNLGYSPSGTPTSTCNNGIWYPTNTAQCVLGAGGNGAAGIVGQCSAIVGALNGEVIYIPMSLTTTYNSGTTASLSCNLGFIPSGQTVATCMNGMWQPPALGSCLPGLGGGGGSSGSQCIFPLPGVLNGNVQYSTNGLIGPYNDGTSATLTCNLGYFPSGTVTSICTNGAWSPPTLGLCAYSDSRKQSNKRKQCRHILHVKEGQIHYSRKASKGFHRFGTLVTLQCHKTYPLTGRFSVCKNGVWTPPIGTCKEETTAVVPTSCSKLAAPMHAKIFYIQASFTNKYEVGTSAVMRCTSGYVINGQTMLTCTDDGWQPETGFGDCILAKKVQDDLRLLR